MINLTDKNKLIESITKNSLVFCTNDIDDVQIMYVSKILKPIYYHRNSNLDVFRVKIWRPPLLFESSDAGSPDSFSWNVFNKEEK